MTTDRTPPAATPPRAPTAAIVAPDGDLTPTVRDLTRQGWHVLAVTLPRNTLPLTATDPTPNDTYTDVVVHDSPRRTLNRLSRHGVSCVVGGSSVGIAVADQLAARLGVTGSGDPATSPQRYDRAAQAQALTLAGLAAPRSLRATSLPAALRWARFCQLPAYALAPADTSVGGPARVCRTQMDISLAWPALRRAARRQAAGSGLVIQEAIAGPQYLIHTVTHHGQHRVEQIWSETRTAEGLADRLDAVPSSGMLARALRCAMPPILDALGVHAGAYRSRIAYAPGHGPVLLSARPDPSQTLLALTGNPTPPPPPRAQLHTTHVALIAPHDATLNARRLRALTSLPTVSRIVGPLYPGAAISRTVGRLTSPGTLVLTGGRRAIDADYDHIRRLEAGDLYVRST